jgi:hypothetical protein
MDLSQSPTPHPSPLSPNIMCFFSFLKAAFDIAEEGAAPHTLTQEKIIEDRDRYLPFRQLGPSKRIILEDPHGPFSPTRLKTREGLFDALIFQLITQASPFLVGEKQVYFGSPGEFQIATKGKDVHYFCNQLAIGQHNRLKNIPHIGTYWDHTTDWVNYANQDGVTLETLLAWFTGHQQNRSRFFGMGNLVGWLLASDYVYAGLVAVPDASEVGEIIFKIDAGGKGGLELLGFEVGTQEACAEAMLALWTVVETNFSSAEVLKMGLEPITLEHALCKFKRLYKSCISKVCLFDHHTKFNLTYFCI